MSGLQRLLTAVLGEPGPAGWPGRGRSVDPFDQPARECTQSHSVDLGLQKERFDSAPARQKVFHIGLVKVRVKAASLARSWHRTRASAGQQALEGHFRVSVPAGARVPTTPSAIASAADSRATYSELPGSTPTSGGRRSAIRGACASPPQRACHAMSQPCRPPASPGCRLAECQPPSTASEGLLQDTAGPPAPGARFEQAGLALCQGSCGMLEMARLERALAGRCCQSLSQPSEVIARIDRRAQASAPSPSCSR